MSGTEENFLIGNIDIFWENEGLLGLVALIAGEAILVTVTTFMGGAVVARAGVVRACCTSILLHSLGVDGAHPDCDAYRWGWLNKRGIDSPLLSTGHFRNLSMAS